MRKFFFKKDTIEKLVALVQEKCQANNQCLEEVCSLLQERINKGNKNHLKDLPSDTKLKGCMEHLTICLTSGEIKKNEIKELLKKF